MTGPYIGNIIPPSVLPLKNKGGTNARCNLRCKYVDIFVNNRRSIKKFFAGGERNLFRRVVSSVTGGGGTPRGRPRGG